MENEFYDDPLQDEDELTKKPEQLEEALRRIQEASDKKSKILNLDNLDLQTIPKETFKLVSLEELNLNGNYIYEVPTSLAQLKNLRNIYYQNTPIKRSENDGYIKAVLKINHALENNERELDLSNLQLEEIPSTISLIENLESLDISHNQLEEIPSTISLIENLESLDISHNQLLEIPEDVFSFNKLLDFHYAGNEYDPRINQITGLCRVNEAKKFNLEEIILSELDLSEIPVGIEECKGLKKLDLYGNFLTEFDSRILELENLTDLYLSGNRIKKIPKEISKLKNLQNFSIYGNLIETIPSEIDNLIHLEELLLNSNKIKSLPSEIGNLENLGVLAINDNEIEEIPESFLNLSSLDELELRDNQFNLIEEVYDRSAQEIIKYIIELQKASKPLHEAKVIFVGSGFVGKTSLVNKIITDKIGNPEKTNGIEIRSWEIPCNESEIKLNIWDFGGQEIMHATHKFFMTNRSIYVLVTSPRIEDKQGESGLEYWLKLIQSYTSKENVPIIIAINKCDVHKVDIGKRELKFKYPNIIDIIETSCTEGIGINKLKHSIKESIKYLPHIEELLPMSYFRIKEKLEKINKDYIQYNEYTRICKIVDTSFDEVNMKGLVGLLHDLGIMLNFNNDRRLYDTQVLNPEWVTNGVYQIITDPILIENKGVLSYLDVDKILDNKRYPSIKEKSYILDIMERFELCFQFENKIDHYFIPGAFPLDPPKVKWKYNSKENIKFVYKYDVLPNSIISRFMVKVHKLICGRFYWRNGVVINENDCFAMIRADIIEREISIEVEGNENKRNFLSKIRLNFNQLHESYGGLKIERYIPIDKDILINYDDLLVYEEAEENSIFVPKLKKKLKVKELLNGIEEKVKPKYKFNEKKIFLSYSHKDEIWKDKLSVHLKSLERQDLITSWDDRMIKPGEEWNKEIIKFLEESEIVILLISPDFIASEFCYTIEMERAIERHEKRECIVIPLIVRSCNWKNLPFSKLQVLPKDGKPINLWEDEDYCINEVINGIVKLI